jgi:GNAT superfamily N-acetyltransferase
MTISFERATEADAEALVRAQVAAFNSDSLLYPGIPIGGPPGYDSAEQMLVKIRQDDCYKIMADGQVVGGIVVFVQEEGHYHLDLLFIDPAYHNRGIGSQALLFLDQAYTATRWTLDTPGYAIRNHHFYQKHGFVKVGEKVLPEITLYEYERRLR